MLSIILYVLLGIYVILSILTSGILLHERFTTKGKSSNLGVDVALIIGVSLIYSAVLMWMSVTVPSEAYKSFKELLA